MREYENVEGLKDLEKLLNNLPIKLRKAGARKALRAGGKIVLAEAKDLAPEKTGTLRENIKLRSGKNKRGFMSMKVGTGKKGDPGPAFYISFLNFGFHPHGGKRHVEGKEFMKQAAQNTKTYAGAAIVSGLRKIIETGDK